nr:hypothetical protein [Chthoniobacteraceae bacterium]
MNPQSAIGNPQSPNPWLQPDGSELTDAEQQLVAVNSSEDPEWLQRVLRWPHTRVQALLRADSRLKKLARLKKQAAPAAFPNGR